MDIKASCVHKWGQIYLFETLILQTLPLVKLDLSPSTKHAVT